MKKKLIITAALAASVALGLTGCTLPVTHADKPAASSAAKPSAKPSTPPPADDSNAVHAYGQTVTWTDGVSITVAAPAPFTPGPYAAGADQAANVSITFTITNGSTKPLNPLAYPQVTSGGAAASAVFDGSQQAGNGPTAIILPGASITWTQAFSVADAGDVQTQVNPSMSYKPAIFH